MCRISRTSLDRLGKVRARFVFYFESHVHAKSDQTDPGYHFDGLRNQVSSSSRRICILILQAQRQLAKVFNVMRNEKQNSSLGSFRCLLIATRKKCSFFISKTFARHFAAKAISQSRAPCHFFFAQFYDSLCVLSVKVSATNYVCVCVCEMAKAKFNALHFFSAS